MSLWCLLADVTIVTSGWCHHGTSGFCNHGAFWLLFWVHSCSLIRRDMSSPHQGSPSTTWGWNPCPSVELCPCCALSISSAPWTSETFIQRALREERMDISYLVPYTHLERWPPRDTHIISLHLGICYPTCKRAFANVIWDGGDYSMWSNGPDDHKRGQ